MSTAIEAEIIKAGALRRIGASLIDSVVLAIIGWLLGLVFAEEFMALRHWGVVVGFVTAGAYFTYSHSIFGGGQTLGKRFLKIYVMKSGGELLSLPQAFMRFCVLGVPFFLGSGLALYVEEFSTTLSMALMLLILVIHLLSYYLIVFNRPTGQTLHDVLVGSYVLKDESPLPEGRSNIWLWHFPIALTPLIILAGAFISLTMVAGKDSQVNLHKDREIARLLNDKPYEQYVTVIPGLTTKDGLFKGTMIIGVQQWSIKSRGEYKKSAVLLVKKLLEIKPSSKEAEVIHVSFYYGFNIGISSNVKIFPFSASPSAWQEEIGKLLKETGVTNDGKGPIE